MSNPTALHRLRSKQPHVVARREEVYTGDSAGMLVVAVLVSLMLPVE